MQKKGLNSKQLFLTTMIALVLTGAVLFSLRFFRSEDEIYEQSKNVFLNNISINGIDIGGMTYNDALDAVVAKAHETQAAWQLEIACNNFTYTTISYSTIGISVDYAAIEDALHVAWEFGHNSSYKDYKRDVALLSNAPYSATIELTEGNGDHLNYVLNIVADNVYRAPQDAEIVLFDPDNPADPFVIRDAVPGQKIDVEAAKTEILRLAADGTSGKYTIPLQSVEAEVTRETLAQNIMLLATGKNAIDKYSTEERNENIMLAFSSINGYILEDGKTFSFNKVVGNRNVENGYKPALGYISGELTEVVGGGVCQVSTTLYSAALCAGLTITERTPHSVPVSYIELGQDATVNYMRGHMIDLKFKNETGYPIYITASVEQNAAGRKMSVVRIYGHSPGENIHYRVESVEVETLPISEEPVIRKDTKAQYVKYTDQTYHYSKGSEGHVVETYLLKLQGSTVIERKLVSKDTYLAQPKIDYVGVQVREE